MVEHWSNRRQAAVENSRKAPSAELRDVFLRVAEHCRSLEESCFTGPLSEFRALRTSS